MTNRFPRIPPALLASTTVFLCASLAGCGTPGDAAPADVGSALRITLSHGCPDGRDLQVRFRDADGTLEASAWCADADWMRPDRGPGGERIPVADQMRDRGESPRGDVPVADRVRGEGEPDAPRGQTALDR